VSREDGGSIGRMPRPLMEDNAAFRFRYSFPNRHLFLSYEVGAGEGMLHMPLVALKGHSLG